MEKTKVKAFIDKVENGFISGWAYNPANFKEKISLNALYNSKIIASGLANNFRQDLLKAKIGDAHHSFRLKISPDFLPDENAEIELFDASTNLKIELLKNSEVKIKAFNAKITTQSLKVKNNLVSYLFNKTEKTLKQSEITFWVDDLLAHTDAFLPENNKLQGEFLLNKKFLDGNLHVLIVRHGNQTIAKEAFISPFHFTPWEYLKADSDTPQFASLSPLAKYRYESLINQLNLITPSQNLEFQQLSAVHEKLVVGFEKNKTFDPLIFPKVENPKASIIIPAHNKFSITYHCLCSLLLAPNKTSFEVILVDDASTDETAQAEKYIQNITIVRNTENLLFLKSCNLASEKAKGEYLIFLNNDTEVTKHWLDELIQVFETTEDAGLVGSKLINADGSLQEAGGVIWKSGTPWNVGYNQNAHAPEYNYLRKADYVSGAAMAIPKKIWEEVNRFSTEYAPAYYEDTDLAFKVREAGKSVYYTPFSQVIHFEGMSNGKDINTGIKKYQKVNEKTFKKKWSRVFKNHGEEGVDLLKEIDRGRDNRILVIDYQTPQLHNDAGSYAALQEIKLLLALNFKVTFVPENLAFFAKFTHYLQRLGVEVIHAPFSYSVKEVLEKRGQEFDAVYITRYNVAKNYIDLIRKNTSAKIIFNNADLHFLRELRAALQNKGNLNQALKTRDEELAVMRQVDVVLSYNEVEHAVILSHNLKEENIFLCPWVVEPRITTNKFKQRNHLVFLGNYNHPPNLEALEFMAQQVMPKLLQTNPEIKLQVFGSNINKKVEALEAENIEILGFADNLFDMFNQAKIFVAPLQSGAGIKGKVLEAMAHGVPTLITPVAAEGTKLSNKISTLIGKTPEEWINQINLLYHDEKLWEKIRQNALTVVNEEFSFDKGLEKFKSAFESVDIFV